MFGTASPQLQRELTALVARAAAVTGMRHGAVNIFDGDRQRQVAAHGVTAADSLRGESICAQLTDTAFGIYPYTDLRTEPRLAGNAWLDGRATVRGYASAPLAFGGGTVGTLCVLDPQPSL